MNSEFFLLQIHRNSVLFKYGDEILRDDSGNMISSHPVSQNGNLMLRLEGTTESFLQRTVYYFTTNYLWYGQDGHYC